MEGIRYCFGFRSSGVAEVAQRLAGTLDAQWELHDGELKGGEYYIFNVPESKVLAVQHNHIPSEWSWEQPKYKSYPVLLYIYYFNRTTAPSKDELLAKITEVFKESVTYIPPEDKYSFTSKIFRRICEFLFVR
jgi:hypothetical protein